MINKTLDYKIVDSESRAARRKRMVAEMSNVRTLKWVGVALVIHLVLIGGTSIGYMRENWFGGKPAADKVAAEEAKPAVQASNTPAPAADKTPAAPAVTPAAVKAAEDDKKLADPTNSNNPEMKKITELPKAGELPKGPSRGFKIDENP